MMMSALWAMPAAAQTASGSAPAAAPTVDFAYVGANAGPAVVDKVSGAAGLEGGVRVWRNLDAIGELGWIGNVATRKQLSAASGLAASLGATQNAVGTGELTASALHIGFGARWVFEDMTPFGVRPYVLGTFGGARVKQDPTFTLNGSDVTATINQYGVTLGKDLAGTYWRNAVTGGVGVVKGFGDWYADGSLRLTSIAGIGRRANATRLMFGAGRRF